jgi:hypothetical protein
VAVTVQRDATSGAAQTAQQRVFGAFAAAAGDLAAFGQTCAFSFAEAVPKALAVTPSHHARVAARPKAIAKVFAISAGG